MIACWLGEKTVTFCIYGILTIHNLSNGSMYQSRFHRACLYAFEGEEMAVGLLENDGENANAVCVNTQTCECYQ